MSNLYTLAINGQLFDAETIKDITSTREIRSDLLNLLAKKLGWFESEQFDNEEVRQMLIVFPYLIKNKGTVKAIREAANAFIDIKQIQKVPFITIDSKNYVITVGIEIDYVDTSLLESVLRYILPTGWTYTIMFTKSFGYEDAQEQLGNVFNVLGSIIETTSINGNEYAHIPTAQIRGTDKIYGADIENTLIGASDMGYVEGSDNLSPTYIITQEVRDDGRISAPSINLVGSDLYINDMGSQADSFTFRIDNVEDGTIYVLDAPTISISGDTVSWSAITNADGYSIYSNGVSIVDTTNTSYDLSSVITESGDYSIYVKAVGDGETYVDSRRSNIEQYIVR